MSQSDRAIKKLATQLARLDREVKSWRGAQADFTSIEAGTMDINDSDGNLVSRVGFQDDGSGAVRFFDGPVPPVPSGVTATSDGPIIQATWDGTFEGGAEATYDLAYLEVAATQVDDDQNVSFATITAKEGASASVVADVTGDWVVAVRSVSQAGKKSEFATAGTVEVKVTDLSGAIEDAQQSANGKNNVTYSESPPTEADEGIVGDTWFVGATDSESGNWNVVAQYQYTVEGWTPVELSHEVIATVDLGKATVGELDGIRIMAKTVGTEQLTADFADFMVARGATLIAGNDRHRLDDDGYAIFDDNGDRRTFLSPEGSTFKGEVEAETLVVNGGAELRGTNNTLAQGAKLTLAAGVTDPTAPPVVQPFWDGIEFTPTNFFTVSGLAWDGTHYWTVKTGLSDYQTACQRIDPATGTVTEFSLPESASDKFGVTCIGSELFWLYRKGYQAFVVVTDLDCVKKREWEYPELGYSSTNPLTYKPAIGNDGTNIVIAHCSDVGRLYVRTYNKTTGAQIGSTVSGDADNYKSDTSGVHVTASDDGVTRIYLHPSRLRRVGAYTTSGVLDSARSFDMAASGSSGVVFVDGKFRTLDPTGKIHEYANSNTGDESGDWWAAYQWAAFTDEDNVIDLWSRISPPTRFTWPRRAKVKIIGQPLPDGAGFIGPALAKKTTYPVRTDFHQPTWDVREGEPVAWYDELPTDWESRTTPRDQNNFPEAESSVLESASGTFRVQGDGSGHWGPLTMGRNGVMSGLIVTGWLTCYIDPNSPNNAKKFTVQLPPGRFSKPPVVWASVSTSGPQMCSVGIVRQEISTTEFSLWFHRTSATETGVTWYAMDDSEA